MKKKEVNIVGLGYVGLPLALVIASNGLKVNGYDVNQDKISLLNKGEVFLDEKDLIDLWNKHNKDMTFSSELIESDIYIIAVPTPLIQKQITCDLSYVKEAINKVSKILKKNDLIILVSTCPVGTTNLISNTIKQITNLNVGEDFFLAYCPERLYPGNTYQEIINNEHIIGGFTKNCSKQASDFYLKFLTKKIVQTTCQLAELVKLSENAYRDVNIAFANELCKISSESNQNIWEVIKLSNLHPRVNILEPGIGVGGHCLPIDPWFLIPSQQKNSSSVIRASRHLNDEIPSIIASKILKLILENRDRKLYEYDVTILGYTYKANSIDKRDSPALNIIKILESFSVKLFAYDPFWDDLDEKDIENKIKNSLLKFCFVSHEKLRRISERNNVIPWQDLII